MKRARPQGLGSAAKKDKIEEEQLIEAPIESGETVAAPSEGIGKLFYELPEEATALDQLRALFESATMFLGNFTLLIENILIFLDDASKSKPIFNGVIHECLRLESIHDSEEGPEVQEGDEKDLDSFLQVKKDADKIFGAEFYFMFGESLRTLGEFEMSVEIEESSLEQVKGLFSAAIDRFQLAKEKTGTGEVSFDFELSNGLLYSMASLCMLIGDNEKLKNDLKSLITDQFKDSVSSAMFDSVEFFCNFIETAYENEFEIEGFEDLTTQLESNISLIEEFCTDLKKLKLVKVDIPLRLAVIQSEVIEGEKADGLLQVLEEILKSEEEPESRFEALQLKASIKEILGLDEEASLIYEEADSIQFEKKE